jgi:septal ring factor EnvC (AmiA/AmiB activator)
MNKVKNYILLILVFILSSTFSYSQSRKQLEHKIKKYERELRLTKKLIQQTKKQKKQTYNNLLIINRQIELREKLINEIKKELDILQSKISENEIIVASLQEDLKEIKKQYARLIYFAWKHSSPYEQIMYVLASESFNQAFMRVKYLQQISDYRKKQAEAIKDIMDILQKKSDDLKQKQQQKQQLLAKLESERQKLTQSKKKQKETIASLQQREKELLEKYKKQQKAAAELKRKVARLIEEEARRARQKSKKSKGSKTKYVLTPEEKIIAGNFKANYGKLPWPVKKGVITGKFGTHEHAVLKGIKVNNDGIYISTVPGATVRSIFKGEVRKVFEVPGKHKIVIIKHGSFYSVYGNLKKVFVKEGDKVQTKQAIGIAYTDENNKTEIELQIWQGLKKVNPEYWLAH